MCVCNVIGPLEGLEKRVRVRSTWRGSLEISKKQKNPKTFFQERKSKCVFFISLERSRVGCPSGTMTLLNFPFFPFSFSKDFFIFLEIEFK
jgi:hypothetical protein